jgi:hypothetical protein
VTVVVPHEGAVDLLRFQADLGAARAQADAVAEDGDTTEPGLYAAGISHNPFGYLGLWG